MADDPRSPVAFQGRDQMLCRGGAELLEVEVDRGQGWPALGREDLPVVVTDDGDVVGDAPAEVPQGVDDAGGDLIAATEDRVDVGVRVEEHARGMPAPAL
jgi:hypothetical protein